MPVTRYGIYLFYAPGIDLRGQGLGRHLSALLKGARKRQDIRFVLACPSWMRRTLADLCQAEGVTLSGFDIVAPPQPLILKLREKYKARLRRPPRASLSTRLAVRLRRIADGIDTGIERRLVGNRSLPLLIVFAAAAIPCAVLWLLAHAASRAVTALHPPAGKAWGFLVARSGIPILQGRLSALVTDQPRNAYGLRLARLIEQSEITRLHRLIRDLHDVAAWYCPTSSWPHFNDIAGPKLICLPDAFVTEFPGNYAAMTGQGVFDNFRNMEKTIAGGDNFVTYSRYTKWNGLVERYQIDPQRVTVIPHGASRLDGSLSASMGKGGGRAIDMLSERLFKSALRKSVGNRYAPLFRHGKIRFLFFASQFRPHKNIITLLRAYDHLLKRRYRGCKLVLTGNLQRWPDIRGFIAEHGLENDILCLKGLSVEELAACYRLAVLAVNPSLSEGGFPFTFTEAISVGTPVVMADIPVTAETIGDEEFYADTTFDPYDWQAMADRIEYALDNRDALYARQRAFYDARLLARGWGEMADDYVALLEQIATTARCGPGGPAGKRRQD